MSPILLQTVCKPVDNENVLHKNNFKQGFSVEKIMKEKLSLLQKSHYCKTHETLQHELYIICHDQCTKTKVE